MIGLGGAQDGRGWSRSLRLDGWMLAATVALLTVGLMAIYSVASARGSLELFRKQVVLLLIGLVPFGLFLTTDLSFWKRSWKALYAINVAFLLLVLVKGSTAGGAQRWLQIGPLQFQPSEMSKLLLVLTLSSFYASRTDVVRRLSTFLLSFLHALPIMLLVFMQPHLGATLVLMVAWLGISVVAGVRWQHIAGMFVVAAILLGSAIEIPGVLKPYQRARLEAMFVKDEKGLDYQALQAAIAFGSGGVLGTGYLKGEQKARGFVPEQHNDFIFSVVGEEGGLVVCSLVLIGFGFLFLRMWLAMVRTIDPFARLCVAGTICVLAFHMTVNLGMNLQILPVVGLWLPFMSYGGTALWLCMACVGLSLNVARKGQPSLY